MFPSYTLGIPSVFFLINGVNHLVNLVPKIPEQKKFQKEVYEENKDFLDKYQIHPIFVESSDATGFGASRAWKYSLVNPPQILFSPHLKEIDPEVFKWILKHECYHIIHADGAHTQIVAGLAMGMIAIFVYIIIFELFPSIHENAKIKIERQSFPLDLILLFSIFKIFNIGSHIFGSNRRKCEFAADRFALTNATEEEIIAGRRQFKALLDWGKKYHQKNKNIFQENGDFVFDPSCTHPPNVERIKIIEKKLIKGGYNLDVLNKDPEEINKIGNLIKILDDCNQPLLYFINRS